MRRLVLGLLVATTLLVPIGASASDVPAPRTIDDLSVSLSADSILVDPVLGTGNTAGVHDLLTRLAEKLDVPVFVVLTSTPADLRTTENPAEQAGAVLNAALGDGLYYIQFTDGNAWTGGFGAAKDIDTGPGLRAATRSRELGPQEYNRPTAAFEAELVLRSAADSGVEFTDQRLRTLLEAPHALVPTEAHERSDLAAQRWVITIAAAAAVLVAGLITSAVAAANPLTRRSRAANGVLPGRHTQPDRPVDSQALERAHRRYDELAAHELASPHAIAAAEALTAADLVSDTGDPMDAVGAWVLALQADRELQRLRRSTQVAYRPCVVNPQHGEASATVRLAGSSIDAPSCASCARNRGAFLMAPTWRGGRPYLETSSVWARTGFGALVDDLPRQVISDREAR